MRIGGDGAVGSRDEAVAEAGPFIDLEPGLACEKTEAAGDLAVVQVLDGVGNEIPADKEHAADQRCLGDEGAYARLTERAHASG